MQFKRQLSYYIVTIYVPTFMIVCVSWMSFWLDHKSAPARVALTITTLLAMSTTTSSINASMPPVSYIKVRRCLQTRLPVNLELGNLSETPGVLGASL